jgi:hypothetical protein
MAVAANTRELKPSPEAEGLFRRWIAHLDEQFTQHTAAEQRTEIVRDELFQIYLGRPHGGKMNATLTSELASIVLAETFDPSNVTMAREVGAELDWEQYGPRRPLIWFWQMFDRSPLGLNLWLGLRFRCMLGHHIFKKVGKGVKIYRGVEFTRGYDLSIEDNCVIGMGALLDDRNGELTLPAGTRVEPGKIYGGEQQS